jgi:hypothetical protein
MKFSGSLVPISGKISGTASAPVAATSHDCYWDAAWITAGKGLETLADALSK